MTPCWAAAQELVPISFTLRLQSLFCDAAYKDTHKADSTIGHTQWLLSIMMLLYCLSQVALLLYCCRCFAATAGTARTHIIDTPADMLYTGVGQPSS